MTKQQSTFKEIKEKSIRMAECLQHEGIKEGDVVGLCSENHIEFVAVLFGTMYLGATLAPFNITYSEGRMHILIFKRLLRIIL